MKVWYKNWSEDATKVQCLFINKPAENLPVVEITEEKFKELVQYIPNRVFVENGELVIHYPTAEEMEREQLEKQERETDIQEIISLNNWFSWYDLQINQYSRAVRLHEEFDKDIKQLDAEAAKNQKRIKELQDKWRGR